MTTGRMTYEEMEARLYEAEGILGALRHHEVDAIVGDSNVALVRLREVEEALHRAREELEERVAERTSELAKVNRQLREIVEEQSHMRQRIEEAQRRLLKAQQIAHLGNWEWNPGSGELWWSDETWRLFGIEPGGMELNYEAFLMLVHPEDRDHVRSLVGDMIEHKRSFSTEFRIVRPDGQERFIHTETEVAVDGEGNVVRLMGVAQDVTERKQTRQQLEQYTCQLREQAELLDLAHDMIFVHDMEGKIVFWNRGAEQGYGWTREEALGRLSYQLLQTEYSEPLIRITAQIIRDGWWEGELTHTTRNGTKVTVATRWALRRESGGRPVAILQIDNDVSRRKQAEQEMAEARRFAESIVDTIRESLVVLDSQLRVISANRSFYDTFGMAPGQIEGQFFPTLSGGRWDVPGLRDRFQEVLTQGRNFEDFEMECDLAEGGPKTLVLGARPVREPIRETGMILLVIQDTTIRKQQEREIQADKRQLASLTEELMLIEERQRRQIAQSLHDPVGESLTLIRQELDALRRDCPAGMQDPLRQMGERLSQAIEWTRSLSLELSPSTLYTHGFQAAIRELAEQFTDCEGFVCRVHAAEEPIPVIEQVRTMLYRAVRELLVNVARHARAENVDITVDRDERCIRVSVEDDGNGFDPSIVNSGRSGGNLGIYSIRERLTRVGGEVIIDSVEGRGTRVILIAPLDTGYESDQGAES